MNLINIQIQIDMKNSDQNQIEQSDLLLKISNLLMLNKDWRNFKMKENNK